MQYAPAASMNQRLRPNGNAQRDLTCQVDFGQHIVYEVAAKMLENRFSNKGLHGIIPFGFGKFQVMFTHPHHVDMAVKDGMNFSGRKLQFDQIERRYVTITIRNCPLEISPDVVREHLSKWGEVHTHEYEMDQKRGWYKGPRKLKMNMKENVPNIFKIGSYTVIATYAGVQLMCKRCQSDKHLVSDCEEHFCFRCRAYGHRTKDCDKIKNKKIDDIQDKETEQTEKSQAVVEMETNENTSFPALVLEDMVNLDPDEIIKELENNEEANNVIDKAATPEDSDDRLFGNILNELDISSESEVDVNVAAKPKKGKKIDAEKKTISPVKKDLSFSSAVKQISQTSQANTVTSTPKKVPDTVLGDFGSVIKKDGKKKKKKGVIARHLFPSPQRKDEETPLVDTRKDIPK